MKYNQSLYPFKSKWITVNKNKIHYVDEGTGQIILFSHAALGSSFMYREFIRTLSGKYRCIAIDYPGFGLSQQHGGYSFSISSQSNVLTSFIKALNLKDIILFGHDTGGPSAFNTAVDQPGLVKGLLLTDTIIFPVNEYPKVNRMLNIVGSKFFSALNAYTNLLVRLTFNFGVRTRKLTKPELRQYFQLYQSKQQRRAITKMLYSLKNNELAMLHIKNGFETVLKDKPCLLIYGEKDPVTQLGIPGRIHKMMPHSKLHLIDEEGHFPHEGKPGEMCGVIENWIDQLAPEIIKKEQMGI